MTWGVPLLVSYHFSFSYCSWDSQGKYTEVACHSLSSGPHSVWPLHHDPPILGCPAGMAWFQWVRQGCGPSVIRLTSFLGVWIQCVCPLMPSCNTYHLTWVSLTLGVGYLFMAAPAKHSRCSLPWMRGISLPFLTFNKTLKQLEREEQRTPKVSIRKEIINIRAEINEEMKEIWTKINKSKDSSLR